MKNIKKILAEAVILSVATGMMMGCGNGQPVKEKLDWEDVKTVDVSHPTFMGGFYNEDQGITVGYAGEVHYTTDGGKEWPRGNNKSMCRFGMDMVSDKIAYSCGNGGNVRKTTDGGQNWEEKADFGQTGNDYKCRYIRFSSENIGWIASLMQLAVTKDGANTWQEVKLPDGVGKILAINLLDDKNGYLIDSNKVLYKSNDFGKSWNKVDLSMEDFDSKTYGSNQMALNFTSENDGELFYYGLDGKLKGFVTSDGGKTWSEEKMPDVEYLGSLYITHDGQYLSADGNNYSKIDILKKNK